MNNCRKIFFGVVIFFFISNAGFSQYAYQPGDSLKKEIKNKPATEQKEQVKKGADADQGGKYGKNSDGNPVKQIRGGRPDMNRTGGARPPVITRPAGSGIPKGMGKPGGAGKHGGR